MVTQLVRLQQVCLAALMAQVGAWVPAQSLTLTPVDAIFVRMGAKDDMMAGQRLQLLSTELPQQAWWPWMSWAGALLLPMELPLLLPCLSTCLAKSTAGQ